MKTWSEKVCKSYDPQVIKIRIKRTPRKVCRRRTPTRRIRIPLQDICRDIVASPVPDLNRGGGPEGGVDAATNAVECGAVRGADVVDGCAALVSAAVATGLVTNWGTGCALGADDDCASWTVRGQSGVRWRKRGESAKDTYLV